MDKRNGFAMIELLVVISIVTLLLSILLPSLERSRSLARRVVCSSNVKQLIIANELYAMNWNDAYVPVVDGSILNKRRPTDADPAPYAWVSNSQFRGYMAFDEKTNDNLGGMTVLPRTLSCPEDRLVKEDRVSAYGTLASYGYNVTEWFLPTNSSPGLTWLPAHTSGGSDVNYYAGHKRSRINSPSGKLAFIDSNDWYVRWGSADYENAWDELGQRPSHDYAANGYDGPTLYRHNEGAVIGFYDGHAECLKKQEVFVREDFRKKPGLWIADVAAWAR